MVFESALGTPEGEFRTICGSTSPGAPPGQRSQIRNSGFQGHVLRAPAARSSVSTTPTVSPPLPGPQTNHAQLFQEIILPLELPQPGLHGFEFHRIHRVIGLASPSRSASRANRIHRFRAVNEIPRSAATAGNERPEDAAKATASALNSLE